MSFGFDDSDGIKKQGFKEKEPYWDANIKWFAFPADSEPHAYRLIAKPTFYGQHWLPTLKKDGTAGKNFSVLCRNFDAVSGVPAENGCKVCQFLDQAWDAARNAAKGKPPEKDKDGKIVSPRPPERLTKASRSITMASNTIIREIQEQGAPGNNTGQWTYVHPLRLPSGAANKIVDKQVKFGHKNPAGGTYSYNHKEFGKDLLITMNAKPASPGDTYVIDAGKNDPVTPLTQDELSQIKFLTNFLEHLKYPKNEEVEEALKKNGFQEWLEKTQAESNLQQISKSAPPAQSPPPPSEPSAFDDGGGIPHSGEHRGVPVESAPAAQADPEDDLPLDLSQFKGGPAPAATASPASTPTAPAQPAAVAVKAEAPAPVAAAPAPAPAAKPAAGATGDLAARIQAFVAANATTKTLVVADKEYDASLGLRFYKVGLSIPNCFTQYTSNDKAVCRQCPVRLDCMMTDG